MANQSFTKNVLKKTTIGIIVGVILVVVAQQTHFPQIFQIMFFIYAMLGTFVFILLDAPPMKRLEGVKALGALIGVLSLAIRNVYRWSLYSSPIRPC